MLCLSRTGTHLALNPGVLSHAAKKSVLPAAQVAMRRFRSSDDSFHSTGASQQFCVCDFARREIARREGFSTNKIDCVVCPSDNMKIIEHPFFTSLGMDGKSGETSKGPQQRLSNCATTELEVPASNLANGTYVHKITVATIMDDLDTMLEKFPYAFDDLVDKCRSGSYKIPVPPYGDSVEVLKRHSLLENDGTVSDDVKNVVLSAVKGNYLNYRLQSPFANSVENSLCDRA